MKSLKQIAHGFARPENRLDFYGRAEEFLQSVLGGCAQPWEMIPGSSANIRDSHITSVIKQFVAH
jgi:hypothetical protein